jgi:hypothetical protein
MYRKYILSCPFLLLFNGTLYYFLQYLVIKTLDPDSFEMLDPDPDPDSK